VQPILILVHLHLFHISLKHLLPLSSSLDSDTNVVEASDQDYKGIFDPDG
jgi:hypothetical protein